MHYFFTESDFKQPDNRLQVINQMGLSHLRFVGANQIHSDNVSIVGSDSPDIIPDCDALVTSISGIALYILTADCVPVLLHDSENGVVAAIHAGWKGTASKIVEKTLSMMCSTYGSEPSNINAIIGPHIHSDCFEVGPEVADKIGWQYVDATSCNGRPMLSLTRANVDQLTCCGVKQSNILVDSRCTFSDNLFSWRRNQTEKRMGSYIYL
ncbi:MAG: peptidoglycan editing factor PgeF [Bacteroidales bacterium]|nr:peptidoglycan editing factor PgeF [Bacteroidales bacterium]